MFLLIRPPTATDTVTSQNDVIYLLTAIGLTPDGSSTVHIYTQTIHRATQSTQTKHRTTQFTNYQECGPCPVFARYTLAFALQLREKHGKTSVRVAGEYTWVLAVLNTLFYVKNEETFTQYRNEVERLEVITIVKYSCEHRAIELQG